MLATAFNKTLIQRKFRPTVAQYLDATVIATQAREQADARQAEILAAGDYRDKEGNRITEPKRSWLIADEAKATEFYALCDQANARAGHDLPAGHCPALIAEMEVIRIENQMLKMAGELIDPVLSEIWCMTKRRECLQLLCKMANVK